MSGAHPTAAHPPSMSAHSFAAPLSALLAAAGLADIHLAPTINITTGNLNIIITTAPRALSITLAGWHHTFPLTNDIEDTHDTCMLALDLIGAALFGAARVLVDLYNQHPQRFTLQLARASQWHTVSTQGSRPWNPFAARTRSTRSVHLGVQPRPPPYAPTPVTPLPWAPWAGACGFFGAAAPADPTQLPVDGELDLHNFHPREVKPLLLAYIDVCLARGLTELRIVHGKGVGNLRRTVHALLDRHPHVTGHRLGGHGGWGGGGWGATIVDLSAEPATRKPSPPT